MKIGRRTGKWDINSITAFTAAGSLQFCRAVKLLKKYFSVLKIKRLSQKTAAFLTTSYP